MLALALQWCYLAYRSGLHAHLADLVLIRTELPLVSCKHVVNPLLVGQGREAQARGEIGRPCGLPHGTRDHHGTTSGGSLIQSNVVTYDDHHRSPVALQFAQVPL